MVELFNHSYQSFLSLPVYLLVSLSAFWMNPFWDPDLALTSVHEPIMGWPDVDHMSAPGVWFN